MNQTFTSQEVAQVVELEPKDIQNWATRKLIVGESDGGRGKPRRYSIHGIMEIAVASAMMRIGLGPERAFAAAVEFAHVGGVLAGFVGETYELRNQRAPGMPYHYIKGRTVLVVKEDGADVMLEEELKSPFRPGKVVALIVDVSSIFDRVCANLKELTGDSGWHPTAILDAAYPEGMGAF